MSVLPRSEYLSELLKDNAENNHCSFVAVPELGRFSNHAPMALVALDRLARLGGIESSYKIDQLLRAQYDKMCKSLWPKDEHIKPGVVMTEENWREYIGQNDCYAHFIQTFKKMAGQERQFQSVYRQKQLSSEAGLANELFADEDANLLSGIAGEAFHPSIHIAYGLIQEDRIVVLTGLAYLAASNAGMTTDSERKQSGLHDFLWKRKAGAGSEETGAGSKKKEKDFMHQFISDLGKQLSQEVKTEGPKLREERSPLMKKFHKVLHLESGIINTIHSLMMQHYDISDPDFSLKVIERIAHYALKLLLKTGPTDILTLHAVTATHAARIISQVLTPENRRSLAVYLWESFATVCLLYEFEGLLFDENEIQLPDTIEEKPWREICLEASKRRDVHDLKLVYTAFDEAHHYDRDDILYKAIAVLRLQQTDQKD